MAVVNAVPEISTSHSQSEVMMTMSSHSGSGQNHQNMDKQCGHCSDQHNCKSSHNNCSTNLGIAMQQFDLAISQYNQTQYNVFNATAPTQLTLPLLRPPITL